MLALAARHTLTARVLATHASRRLVHYTPPRAADERWQTLTNILADDNPPPVQVKSISTEGIQLADGLILPGAVIFLDGKVLLWNVPSKLWQGWTVETFGVFETVVPRPEILLLGTGKNAVPPPAALRNYLRGLGIQLDVMNSWNACSTYNLLAEEGRRVAAALLPHEPMQWR